MDNIVEEVRKKTDIVDLISEYIPLIKKGKNYFGVCPFHDDSNPSMSVSREKQIYKCFSCGASGNIYNFLMDYEHIDFKEALSKLSSKLGINIENTTIKVNNKFDKFYEIYDLTSKLYQNNLLSEKGSSARNYLKSRNISLEEIKKFNIGLSFSNKKVVKQLEKKYNLLDLEDVGLISNNHDIFQNRIMFPLMNLENKTVAFSGRIYDTNSKDSKYINTKETNIFKKGEILYNYYACKEDVRIKKYLILVEGFMDVIRLSTIGIKNVVATMGTSLTINQIKLLKRLSNNIYLCFDGDNPGKLANINNGEELIKHDINIKVISLDNNDDPDSYVLKNGKEKFETLIEEAKSYQEYYMEYQKDNISTTDIKEVTEYINKVLEKLKYNNNAIEKELVLKKLAKDFDISYNTLENRLKDYSLEKNTNLEIKSPKKEEKTTINKYYVASRDLIMGMLYNNKIIDIYKNYNIQMINNKFDAILNEILYRYDVYGSVEVAEIFDEFISNDEEKEFFKTLIIDEEVYSDDYYIDCIKSINECVTNQKIKYLQKMIEEEKDVNKQIEYLNTMGILKNNLEKGI
ncbi:MAG: DNA primase [Clostridiales bacterium]|nr:DNA primase [Clostridiales bacterium]